MQTKLLVIISMGFDVTDQHWSKDFHSSDSKKKWEYDERVHQLFIYFKKTHDSVRREVLHNILTEFWVPMKLVRLIKMSLDVTYSKVHIVKHLSDTFSI
jgi:hypothetical protein